MKYTILDKAFSLSDGGRLLLEHSPEHPLIYVGMGEADIDMYRGNFDIRDYISQRIPLSGFTAVREDEGLTLVLGGKIKLRLTIEGNAARLRFESLDAGINRFWLRLPAERDEGCYGCGEQMSYFNLRGRHFPLWTSEPGVGRDKSTYITWRSDVENKSGGDYYNTNFPQPSFISSRMYYLHADCTAYADFDFSHEDFHELQFWAVPQEIRIETGKSYLELVSGLSALLGRQPPLPDWVYEGMILGLQGGTERVCRILDESLDNGIAVSGVWIQDWEGKRVTSFGKRLQWDWRWNREMYPGLPEKMREYGEKGIRFLGYINPYLVNDGVLYKEGLEKGYFALDSKGETYLVDFGEFNCGVVDFTNPAAYNWFKGIIKENLIGFGLGGWMADFGEYLPVDVRLYNGMDPLLAHNLWPVLWAKCNYEALAETGKLGKLLVFMRAGGAGTQKYCPLLWAGDQSVDFSIHDGLASVIVGALSAGVSGFGLTHSDIGGYTSVFDNCRTKELFLRWAEMAAFTPVMRSHEGNRPDTNFQYYDDTRTQKDLARITGIYKALSPYIKAAVSENAQTGIPVQRPLLLHYDDRRSAAEQTEYLLGRDMLVAPVYTAGAQERSVYLPDDHWIHLWTGVEYGMGEASIAAPLGYPPVFYRQGSRFETLFARIGRDFA